MKNTIDDLRNHLFAVLEGLMDPEKPISVEQARAVNQTAQSLIKCAKVEVDYLDVTGQDTASAFFKHTRPLALPATNRQQ
jgi:hypothetical protein